jgi:hypothetical protein
VLLVCGTWIQAFKDMLAAGSSALPPEIADFAPRLADVPANLHRYVADGVLDDRWKHHCDGILHKFGGGGNEILWLACSSISVRVPGRRQMPTLATAAKSGPGTESVEDWVPDNAAYVEIRELNAKNVKDTENKGTISIVAGGAVVLIGPGHKRRPGDYVGRQNDVEEGQITVTKGGAVSKGEIKVNGISAKSSGSSSGRKLNPIWRESQHPRRDDRLLRLLSKFSFQQTLVLM